VVRKFVEQYLWRFIKYHEIDLNFTLCAMRFALCALRHASKTEFC